MSQILPLIKRIAQNVHDKNGDGRVEKFFIFKFGRKSFAVPAVDVAEVATPGSLIDIPQKSETIIGVVNVRGIVIPVVNLRSRLDQQQAYEITDDSKLLLFQLKAGSYIGMITDDIEYRLRDGIVEPYPGIMAERTMRNVVIEHEKYPLFMIDVWLEKDEIETLQNVVESF